MYKIPVGIDLGTTYSVIAVVSDTGEVRVLHNDRTSSSRPQSCTSAPRESRLTKTSAMFLNAYVADDPLPFFSTFSALTNVTAGPNKAASFFSAARS